MTIFVDASALVSMVRRESDASALGDVLEGDEVRLTSAVALWETVRAVAKRSGDLKASEQDVEQLRAALNIVVVPIGSPEAEEAVRAHCRYGKGTGHPAKLNMGDCFAYACAKTNGARLLYKGDDFVHTDLR